MRSDLWLQIPIVLACKNKPDMTVWLILDLVPSTDNRSLRSQRSRLVVLTLCNPDFCPRGTIQFFAYPADADQ